MISQNTDDGDLPTKPPSNEGSNDGDETTSSTIPIAQSKHRELHRLRFSPSSLF